MPRGQLQRTYLLRGLDRVLYSTQPQWHEGTFFQNQEEEGHLVLQVRCASRFRNSRRGAAAPARIRSASIAGNRGNGSAQVP